MIFMLMITTQKKVIRTRSVEYMPFLLSFVSFVNAGIWTAYSLIYKLDLYVLVSVFFFN